MTPKAIVVAHADLAAGLVSAVEAITGLGGMFVAVSNTGLGSAELAVTMSATLKEIGSRVVFTDLQMGSCSMAAHRLMRERADVIIVTGVNLPMLLYAATHESDPPETMAAQALERAREALRVVTVATPKGTPAATPPERPGAD
ncbi:MAG: hypothetical protein M3081_08705 [Gemmatimonadota bacterium]|nr:hypothetical protein [Gemmatimonadota bacterium]